MVHRLWNTFCQCDILPVWDSLCLWQPLPTVKPSPLVCSTGCIALPAPEDGFGDSGTWFWHCSYSCRTNQIQVVTWHQCTPMWVRSSKVMQGISRPSLHVLVTIIISPVLQVGAGLYSRTMYKAWEPEDVVRSKQYQLPYTPIHCLPSTCGVGYTLSTKASRSSKYINTARA